MREENSANLSKPVFSMENLHGAHIAGANLSNVNLNKVDLSGADLEGANLSNGNLFRADLEGANLANTNCSNAVLEAALLSYANLTKANHNIYEIAAGTVHNCVKCVRLLLEMNDISLNWKKISRILHKARRYALDRVPTPGEIREILDASDIRGKPLTLLLVSSGIREGAIEILHVGDYTPIRKNSQTVAGRLVVYAGHPEQYVALITFEACAALDKYLEFRKENNENITNASPLFRDTFDPTVLYNDLR